MRSTLTPQSVILPSLCLYYEHGLTVQTVIDVGAALIALCLSMQPWYSQKIPAEPCQEAQQLPDSGQPIALTAGTDLLLTDAAIRRHKHGKDKKDKHSKKGKHSDKDTKAAGAKSVEVLRAERQAREQVERVRQDRLLRAHRGFAQPAAR